MVVASEVMIYADNTVIDIADREVPIIDSEFTKEMDAVAKWFDENALIIILKNGKTESLHFGTPSWFFHAK